MQLINLDDECMTGVFIVDKKGSKIVSGEVAACLSDSKYNPVTILYSSKSPYSIR